MGYSVDLREAALAALDNGMTKWEVHKTFKVSRTSLDDWLRLREKTGKLEDIKYRHGPKAAIANTSENHAFFEKHKHKTLAQLCDLWFEKSGKRLSDVTLSRTLKRFGYTRKKRVTSIKNEMI